MGGEGGKRWRLWCLLLAGTMSSCSTFSHTNERIEIAPEQPPASQASFEVRGQRGRDDLVVILTLSGGGSRAAWFAAAIMFELENLPGLNLLHEVDAISSVSGGSLAAAYYCISSDVEHEWRPTWEREAVCELLSRNYVARWIANWFWPHNVLLLNFTAYDKADIMAEVFADNLFDVSGLGRQPTLGDLDPDRPVLILNATDGTRDLAEHRGESTGELLREGELHFGRVFTFTTEDFTDKLGSDINRYELARAVMASACFPGAFPYMSLRNFRAGSDDEVKFVHVFDGGNSDNLGLLSARRIIKQLETGPFSRRPRGYIVISVDAYTKPKGIDRDTADPRDDSGTFLVDFNFMDSIDMLLTQSRFNHLMRFASPSEQFELRSQMRAEGYAIAQQVALPVAEALFTARSPRDPWDDFWEPRDLGDRLLFWHLQFADVESRALRKRLNRIATNFSISTDGMEAIEEAAHELVRRNREKLAGIRSLLGMPLTLPDEF